jgi:site-specific recombinase XerD
LDSLESVRGNHVRSRNQRLASIRTFFEYIGRQIPERLQQAQRVVSMPTKRTPPPTTPYLEREEIEQLFSRLPTAGRNALRDRALLLFLYNSGARAQEVADPRIANLEFTPQPRGKR